MYVSSAWERERGCRFEGSRGLLDLKSLDLGVWIIGEFKHYGGCIGFSASESIYVVKEIGTGRLICETQENRENPSFGIFLEPEG